MILADPLDFDTVQRISSFYDVIRLYLNNTPSDIFRALHPNVFNALNKIFLL